MTKVLIFILAFAHASFVMGDQLGDDLNNLDASIKCSALMNENKRLEPLRGNVLIWERSELKSLDQLNRYPTTKEKKALAIFYDLKLQCDADLHATEPNEYLTLLGNLRDGKITYAELLDWQDRQTKEALAEIEKMKDKKLSCILESPNNMAGVEIQYSFNESLNTIWASRGGKPENVKISDTEITYRTSESGPYLEASISRNTGRLTMTFHTDGGISFINGSCHAATDQKF